MEAREDVRKRRHMVSRLAKAAAHAKEVGTDLHKTIMVASPLLQCPRQLSHQSACRGSLSLTAGKWLGWVVDAPSHLPMGHGVLLGDRGAHVSVLQEGTEAHQLYMHAYANVRQNVRLNPAGSVRINTTMLSDTCRTFPPAPERRFQNHCSRAW